MILFCITCLTAPVALGCDNKSNDGGHITGEVVSVSEMDTTTNKTAIVVNVTDSDIITTPQATIHMDGGWSIPREYRNADIDTQIRGAVPCIVSDIDKGQRTFLVVVGQTICARLEREPDGQLVIAKLGTIFLPGVPKDRDGLAVVRAALRNKATVDLRVYENPPGSLWVASMAMPDARVRTRRSDAEWIEFWPYLLRDEAPVSIDAFLASE